MPQIAVPAYLKGPFHLDTPSGKITTTLPYDKASGAGMASSSISRTRYYMREGKPFRIHRAENRILTVDVWVYGKGIVEADPIFVIYAAREISEGYYLFLVARSKAFGFFLRLFFCLVATSERKRETPISGPDEDA